MLQTFEMLGLGRNACNYCIHEWSLSPVVQKDSYCQPTKVNIVADLRRRPEGAMAPLREEKAVNKAHKVL